MTLYDPNPFRILVQSPTVVCLLEQEFCIEPAVWIEDLPVQGSTYC